MLVSYFSMICRTCSLFRGGYSTSFSLESRCLRLMKSMNWSKEMNGFLLEPLEQRKKSTPSVCMVPEVQGERTTNPKIILSMCHIPFLKDALYLRPETEAVHKLLEGVPREIIWLESLWLEENREDCAERDGKKKKEAWWFQRHFDPGNIQSASQQLSASSNIGGWTLMTLSVCGSDRLFPLCVFPCLGSRRRQSTAMRRETLTVQFAQSRPLIQKRNVLSTPHWFLGKIAPINNTQETLFYLPNHSLWLLKLHIKEKKSAWLIFTFDSRVWKTEWSHEFQDFKWVALSRRNHVSPNWFFFLRNMWKLILNASLKHTN